MFENKEKVKEFTIIVVFLFLFYAFMNSDFICKYTYPLFKVDMLLLFSFITMASSRFELRTSAVFSAAVVYALVSALL